VQKVSGGESPQTVMLPMGAKKTVRVVVKKAS
jgi:hypothetical protein